MTHYYEHLISTIQVLFVLLVVYQIKHFVADYPMQNEYMLKKFLPDWGFFKPLLAHAGVHATFTFFIVLCVLPNQYQLALTLALVDFVIHFFMDRLKAGPKYLGRFKPLTASEYIEAKKDGDIKKINGNRYFWWALGLDQMIHHLTHYVILYFLIVEFIGKQ